MFTFNAKRICWIAMLAALSFLLNMVQIRLPANLRVTFDSHIRTSLYHQGFLEGHVADIDAGDRPRDRILEIKYDAFLPGVIESLIQTGGVRQQAFSKYQACRRFG